MQQIGVVKCTTSVGNHLRRIWLVVHPSQNGTLMIKNPTTTSSAMTRWVRVITALVYAIKLLLNALLAIEVQATIQTLIIGRVYAPKRLRHLKMTLKGVHLYGIVVKHTQMAL
jgi:hypothetical protein